MRLLLKTVCNGIDVRGAVSIAEDGRCGAGVDGEGNATVENNIDDTGKLSIEAVSVLLDRLTLSLKIKELVNSTVVDLEKAEIVDVVEMKGLADVV